MTLGELPGWQPFQTLGLLLTISTETQSVALGNAGVRSGRLLTSATSERRCCALASIASSFGLTRGHKCTDRAHQANMEQWDLICKRAVTVYSVRFFVQNPSSPPTPVLCSNALPLEVI